MKKVTILGMVIISALLVFSCSRPPAEKSGTHNTQSLTPEMTQQSMVGEPAPNFQLNDLNGNPTSLSHFRGNPVLLNFWTTWDPSCLAERPAIQQIYDDWQSRGLIVLTIDVLNSRPGETQDNLTDFMEKTGYSFPVLLDENQLATIRYYIGSTPTSVLIDKDGIIREIKAEAFPDKATIEESLSKILPELDAEPQNPGPIV